MNTHFIDNMQEEVAGKELNIEIDGETRAMLTQLLTYIYHCRISRSAWTLFNVPSPNINHFSLSFSSFQRCLKLYSLFSRPDNF